MKLTVGNCLLGVFDNPDNHKFIARIDIKNIVGLLRIQGELMPNMCYIGLKLLNRISTKDEFLDAFQTEKLPNILTDVMNRQISMEVNLEALDILGHMLNSIYVKETVAMICQVENNMGLEVLAKLCIPPTTDNVYIFSTFLTS